MYYFAIKAQVTWDNMSKNFLFLSFTERSWSISNVQLNCKVAPCTMWHTVTWMVGHQFHRNSSSNLKVQRKQFGFGWAKGLFKHICVLNRSAWLVPTVDYNFNEVTSLVFNLWGTETRFCHKLNQILLLTSKDLLLLKTDP